MGPFCCLLALHVFFIMQTDLLLTNVALKLNSSNTLQFTCHCYAVWTTQKRASERIVLTPWYV